MCKAVPKNHQFQNFSTKRQSRQVDDFEYKILSKCFFLNRLFFCIFETVECVSPAYSNPLLCSRCVCKTEVERSTMTEPLAPLHM